MATMRVPEWTLGERLAKARKEAGLTQEEIAELLQVSHSTVAKWEGNVGQPRDMLSRIHQWSELTRVDFHWLITDDPPRKKQRGKSRPTNQWRLAS